MVVCCGLVYEVGMRNTPDVGTVVVGVARNDACLWRVVACLRSSPLAIGKPCEQCVVPPCQVYRKVPDCSSNRALVDLA